MRSVSKNAKKMPPFQDGILHLRLKNAQELQLLFHAFKSISCCNLVAYSSDVC